MSKVEYFNVVRQFNAENIANVSNDEGVAQTSDQEILCRGLNALSHDISRSKLFLCHNILWNLKPVRRLI